MADVLQPWTKRVTRPDAVADYVTNCVNVEVSEVRWVPLPQIRGLRERDRSCANSKPMSCCN